MMLTTSSPIAPSPHPRGDRSDELATSRPNGAGPPSTATPPSRALPGNGVGAPPFRRACSPRALRSAGERHRADDRDLRGAAVGLLEVDGLTGLVTEQGQTQRGLGGVHLDVRVVL